MLGRLARCRRRTAAISNHDRIVARAGVTLLTGSGSRLDHAQAVEAGAAAVLPKTAPTRDIVEAIRRVRAGEVLMPPAEVIDLLRLLGQERERERQAAATFARRTAGGMGF